MQASTDPLIALMRNIDPAARELRKQYDDQVDAVEKRAGAKIARTLIRPLVDTTNRPMLLSPAAELWCCEGLRGKWEANSLLHRTRRAALPCTAENGNKPPYQLPESWMKAKSKLKLDHAARLRFDGRHHRRQFRQSDCSTRRVKSSGIIFDGNIQSLEWNFVYEDKQARAVHVDSRGDRGGLAPDL